MERDISDANFMAAAQGAGAKLVRFTLQYPCMITSRLMRGVRIGDATISIEYGGVTDDRRRKYHYYIDLADGTEYENDDLASGVGGGSLQSGLESLLSFLGACGESWAYDCGDGERGENADMFPPKIAEWASQNDDEISDIRLQLEEEVRDAIVEGDRA